MTHVFFNKSDINNTSKLNSYLRTISKVVSLKSFTNSVKISISLKVSSKEIVGFKALCITNSN